MRCCSRGARSPTLKPAPSPSTSNSSRLSAAATPAPDRPFHRTLPMPDSSPANYDTPAAESAQAAAPPANPHAKTGGGRARLFGILGGVIAIIALVVVL